MNRFILVGVLSTLSITACGGGSSSLPQASLPQASPTQASLPNVSSTKTPLPNVSSTTTPLPQASPTQAPLSKVLLSVKTENCITSSYGWTSDDGSPTNNFVVPAQADLAIFKETGFTCARIPIGSGTSEDASYVTEANAYHAAGITVQGVISSADINNLPPASVFAVSDEIEAGNELDVAPNYTAALAIAYTKAVAVAARAVNPQVKIISGGVTSLVFLSQTIPSLTNVIDCVGVHPYGMIPANFGAIATAIRNEYGLNVCFTEWGDTLGNPLTPLQVGQGYNSSQGIASEFNFFNLGQLEADVNELNVL